MADIRAFFGLVAGAQFADLVPAQALRRVAALLESVELPANLDVDQVLPVLEKVSMRSGSDFPASLDEEHTMHVIRAAAEALGAKYPDLKAEDEA